jgi:hypothetical protein
MWVLVMTSPSCHRRSLSLSRAAGIAVIWKNRGLSRELTRINTNQRPFAADFRGWALIKGKAFAAQRAQSRSGPEDRGNRRDRFDVNGLTWKPDRRRLPANYKADKTTADTNPTDGPPETTRLIDVNGFINIEQGEQQTKHSGTQGVFVVKEPFANAFHRTPPQAPKIARVSEARAGSACTVFSPFQALLSERTAVLRRSSSVSEPDRNRLHLRVGRLQRWEAVDPVEVTGRPRISQVFENVILSAYVSVLAASK